MKKLLGPGIGTKTALGKSSENDHLGHENSNTVNITGEPRGIKNPKLSVDRICTINRTKKSGGPGTVCD